MLKLYRSTYGWFNVQSSSAWCSVINQSQFPDIIQGFVWITKKKGCLSHQFLKRNEECHLQLSLRGHVCISSNQILKESHISSSGTSSWFILLYGSIKKYRYCISSRKWIQAKTRNLSLQNYNFNFTWRIASIKIVRFKKIQRFLPSKVFRLIDKNQIIVFTKLFIKKYF